MHTARYLTLDSVPYETREEVFEGRPHLVVPVVALVHGVLHAMNSATPELVTAEEFTRPAVVGGFNGRPLFHGHPIVNGEPVPGNSPKLLEEKAIGRVFNACVKKGKLVVEAWIDIGKCEEVAPDLLERVRSAKSIEISVGVFCESDEDETGDYEGKHYAGAWRDIVPDHLALLIEGDRGACSNAMGCGVRTAIGNGNNQYKHDNATQDGKSSTGGAGAHQTYSGKGGQFGVSNPDGEAWHVTDKKGNTVHLSSTKAKAVSKAREYAKHGFKGRPIIGALSENINREAEMADEEMDAEFRTLRNIPQAERDKMAASDFAGPGRSFPIAEPEDVGAAATSLGRAKGNKDAIKRKIIAIAYRKGASFVAQLPEDWKKKKDQKNAGLFGRLLAMFRAEQAPDEMSDNDIRRNLLDALREDDKTANYVEAFYPNSLPALVVYSCVFPSTACGPEMGMGYQSCLYQRSYTVDDNGVVTLGADIAEVEPVLTYQLVPETPTEVVAAQAQKTAQGAPCQCQNHKDTRSAIDMNKEQIVKFLETATDEQVKALSAVAEPPAPAPKDTTKVETPAPVAEVKVETPVAVAAAKTPTFEEILATAEPSVREAIAEGQRVGADKRTTTIKALKDTGRCDMTDKEFAALSQVQLDQLMKLAGAPKVDFSVAGASRPQESTQEIPAAPDMTTAVRAARGIKEVAAK